MARRRKVAMNSLNVDLEFTVETAEDYDDKKLSAQSCMTISAALTVNLSPIEPPLFCL